MRNMFRVKYEILKNSLKISVKYYTSYFTIVAISVVMLVGFWIYRTYSENYGVGIGEYLRLTDIISALKNTVIVISAVCFITIMNLLQRFYKISEKIYRYLPISKLHILLTETVFVLAAAFIMFAVPIFVYLHSLEVQLQVYAGTLTVLLILNFEYIAVPLCLYAYLVSVKKRRIWDKGVIVSIQLLMTIQNGCFVNGQQALYWGLVGAEAALCVILLILLSKHWEELRFYDYRDCHPRTKKKETQSKHDRYDSNWIMLLELMRNKKIFAQFLLVPVVMILISKIMNMPYLERYIYRYTAFIPCFFIGMYMSYEGIYKNLPLNKRKMIISRLLFGILCEILLLEVYAQVFRMTLTGAELLDNVLFAMILYAIMYISKMKLMKDDMDNPIFYILLVLIEYVYSTLVLYIQEFFFMGFEISVEKYMISAVGVVFVGYVCIEKSKRVTIDNATYA